jgi:hypothetical protein
LELKGAIFGSHCNPILDYSENKMGYFHYNRCQMKEQYIHHFPTHTRSHHPAMAENFPTQEGAVAWMDT